MDNFRSRASDYKVRDEEKKKRRSSNVLVIIFSKFAFEETNSYCRCIFLFFFFCVEEQRVRAEIVELEKRCKSLANESRTISKQSEAEYAKLHAEESKKSNPNVVLISPLLHLLYSFLLDLSRLSLHLLYSSILFADIVSFSYLLEARQDAEKKQFRASQRSALRNAKSQMDSLYEENKRLRMLIKSAGQYCEGGEAGEEGEGDGEDKENKKN